MKKLILALALVSASCISSGLQEEWQNAYTEWQHAAVTGDPSAESKWEALQAVEARVRDEIDSGADSFTGWLGALTGGGGLAVVGGALEYLRRRRKRRYTTPADSVEQPSTDPS